jgi:hypothetical protein
VIGLHRKAIPLEEVVVLLCLNFSAAASFRTAPFLPFKFHAQPYGSEIGEKAV